MREACNEAHAIPKSKRSKADKKAIRVSADIQAFSPRDPDPLGFPPHFWHFGPDSG